ncbi:hypothetical protein CGRA01v4_04007 [Colletotrichum graminicola]|uniref:Uncharacterized protein n=1 Tax=Colletotrichum graminicola (strain M1.001 / M2 / FGSC 10212) TaxID=645133 RepID=E3QZ54_COLGM|nr:uncharacterized protein GLRG_11286 [Colletotrichum graminicola M1.001]EFQ36142.1 hypothetical protein GLRG_11286 [Colletotrichum graminicola M1.001]WDK12727.1 hypothetical protein CGRA01v4_04007 [Colletotrichum graminicola]
MDMVRGTGNLHLGEQDRAPSNETKRSVPSQKEPKTRLGERKKSSLNLKQPEGTISGKKESNTLDLKGSIKRSMNQMLKPKRRQAIASVSFEPPAQEERLMEPTA